MSGQHLKVSKRYARALLSLSQENHIMDRTYKDMKLVSHTLGLNKELQAFLRSPIIREGKKQRVLSSIFESRIHPLLMKYMLIIVRKQRASLLLGVARAYLIVYKEAMGIELVKVTTALPMDKALREKALHVAKSLTSHDIEFVEAVDSGIIGGFILDLGDLQYDASIRSKLVSMRKQFSI